MFSISFWQWILELAFVGISIVHIFFLVGISKFLDELWVVYVHFHIQTINAFYLFGDNEFHRNVVEYGFFRAVWRME